MSKSLRLGGAVGLDDNRAWSEVVSCPATAAEPFREVTMGADLGYQGSNAENLALNLGAKILLDFLKSS